MQNTHTQHSQLASLDQAMQCQARDYRLRAPLSSNEINISFPLLSASAELRPPLKRCAASKLSDGRGPLEANSTDILVTDILNMSITAIGLAVRDASKSKSHSSGFEILKYSETYRFFFAVSLGSTKERESQRRSANGVLS